MALDESSAAKLVERIRALDASWNAKADFDPLPSEQEEVSRLLEQANQCAAHTHQELLTLRRRVQLLESQQEVLEDFTVKGRRFADPASSPVHAIPNDVLWSIFCWLQDWNCMDHINCEESEWVVTGWPLTLVCSRWRRVAIRTPELWSKIQLCVSYADEETPDISRRRNHVQFLIELLLQRSATLPLDIRLNHGWAGDIEAHPALDTLWKSCQRWQSLRIEGCCQNQEDDKFYGHCQLTSLERVALDIGSEDVFRLCLEAPRLRSVRALSFESDETTFPGSFIGHTFDQVTALDLSLSDWQEAIALFPNVECVSLHLDGDFGIPEGQPYVLPTSCRTLVLNDIEDGHHFAKQLECFNAPKITKLIANGQSPDPDLVLKNGFPTRSLSLFVDLSGCRLTYLALYDIVMHARDAYDISDIVQSGELDFFFCHTGHMEDLVRDVVVKLSGEDEWDPMEEFCW